MANPFSTGGNVQYIPGRVKTPYGDGSSDTDDNGASLNADYDDKVRELLHNRDLIAADLLETDMLLDKVDEMVDQQMAEFAIPGGDAAKYLCGSETIDWECYKKAKELMKIAPWIANGYDPVQVMLSPIPIGNAGNIIYDCVNFDEDKFQNAVENLGGIDDYELSSDDFNDLLGVDSYQDIQDRAEENQKRWALRLLWWDFLWGKPNIKPSVIEERKNNKSVGIDAIKARVKIITNDIRKLGENKGANASAIKAKTDERNSLNKSLAMSKLPDVVRDGRPVEVDELMWEAFPKSSGPLEHVIQADAKGVYHQTSEYMNTNAAAVYMDPLSLFKKNDVYKDKGLPSIKMGMVLSLILGFLTMPPKAIASVMKLRQTMLSKFAIIRKLPIVGKKLYKLVKWSVGIFFYPVVVINNVFINMCIDIAMRPKGIDHEPISFPATDYNDELVNDINAAGPTLNDEEILDTLAGWVPINCMENAQRIINKVHTEAAL